jgi:pyridoxine kinase
MSAQGMQVCPVPTAVLSTHTGGFEGVVIRDLTDYIMECYDHYKSLNVEFDAVYSGFLANASQIDHCLKFFKGYKNSLKVVDPVMGDHGKPYRTCTKELRTRMSELAGVADVITPNLTEAAFLLGEEYPAEPLSQGRAKSWLAKLSEKVRVAVITSVPMADDKLSNIGYDRESGGFWRVDCDFVPAAYPGTGDIFAAVLTGAILNGESLPMAINRATVFTQITVKTTFSYCTDTRNGVMFEHALPWLSRNETLFDFKRI